MRVAELFYSIQGEGAYAGTPTVFVRTAGCNLRCWFCDTPYTSWRPEGPQRRWQDVLDEVLRFDCRHVDVTGGEPLLQPDVVPLTHALRESGRFVTIETAGTVYRPVAADLMSISPKLANSTPKGNARSLPKALVPASSKGSPYRHDAASRRREPAGRYPEANASGSPDPEADASGSPLSATCESWAKRHEARRHNPEVIDRLCRQFDYQLKFVIDKPDDLADVEAWLHQFPHIPLDRVWLMPQAVTVGELEAKSGWLQEMAESRGFRVSPRLHIAMFGNARGT